MPSAVDRSGWSALAAVLVAAALAGVVLRIYVHVSSLGVLDGDEAVWGLMARHLLHGQLSTFFWGQGYGGTQEVLLTAPLFALFGSSVLVMRLVPLALTGVATVLVWRIGRRTIGEPAARIAGALLWVWPPYLVWKSDRAHGFYGSGLVLVSLLLLLVLRLAERRSRVDAALLGLVAGLGWWQTPQVVPIAVPALVWLAWKRPCVWRDGWAILPAALIGALPWLLSNLHHQWWSFHIDSGDTPYIRRLRGFFSSTLPMATGLRVPFTSEWLIGAAASALVYAGLVALLAVIAWRRRRSDVMVLLFGIVAVFPFLYALSPATWLVDEPRYVVVLLPVLVLLLAQRLTSVRRGAAAVGAAVALSAFVLAHLASSPEYDRRADGLDVPRHLAPLVSELDRRGLDRVFAGYWVAYRIDFEQHERIVAAEALLPTLAVRGGRVVPRAPRRFNDNRHPAYDAAVRADENAGFVLLEDAPEDSRARPLLERAGYARDVVGGFAVYRRGRP